MKVKNRNVPVYFEQNNPFSKSAEGLVQDIFQHQAVGNTGYVAARTSSPFLSRPRGDDAFPKPDEATGKFDISGLGPYERTIFSRLVFGKYRTTVLKGDMGSGKSAAIDCLTEALRRPRSITCGLCETRAPIVIKLNFNAGFQISDINDVLREFRQQLYDQLRQELRQLFAEGSLSNAFREKVIGDRARVQNDNVYAAFDRFVQGHEDSVAWKKRTDLQKANLLFSYVDERTGNGTQSLGVLMTLIRFTKESLRADPGCFILFFDNIDSIEPEAQNPILNEILGYQEIAQVQALVTLRRSNFVRFDQNHATHTFGVIDHVGPAIKEVVLRRLNYYADHWDSLPEVQALENPAHRQAVRARLDYLLKIEDDPRGAIERTLSICGASIRLGLYMSERFFINSAVPFDENPRYRDDLVRAVLVGNSESNEISPDDFCIANLLLNKLTGEASLVNIRILHLVAELEHDESSRTVRNLVEMLNKIGGWSKDEVRIAFNYLLNFRRPLMWVDGKTSYDTQTITRDADDVLHLTEAGNFYVRQLLLDLVYVQQAALSVRWNAVHIPAVVDHAKEVERFQFLRCLLEELANHDHRETKNLKQWLSTQGTAVSITPCLLINRMIAALGKSVLHILLPRISGGAARPAGDEQLKVEILEELRNWRSMINIWLHTETDLLGTRNWKLEQLSKEYRDRVPLG